MGFSSPSNQRNYATWYVPFLLTTAYVSYIYGTIDFNGLRIVEDPEDSKGNVRQFSNYQWTQRLGDVIQSRSVPRDLSQRTLESMMTGRGECYDVYSESLRAFPFQRRPLDTRDCVVIVA
jgi:hypothetical protein